MSGSVRVGRKVGAALAASLLLLVSAARTSAQPPAQPADAAAVDLAIERGVRYLLEKQKPAGHWGDGTGAGAGKGWTAGYTSLAGLALIEAGVSNTDPQIKKAASVVRSLANELDSTYEVSLAILFLDRVGVRSDRRTIQVLAGRLIAGQTPTGGWGYKLPKPTAPEHEALISALRRTNPPPPPQAPSHRDRPASLGLCIKASDDTFHRPPPPFDPDKARTAALATLSPGMRQWSVFLPANRIVLADPAEKRSELFNGTTDNSNTHFATLAVWAARRHDVPVERTLDLLAQRFRTSQNADGTWAYDYAKGGKGGGAPAMTCVALLGLAIGHVVDPDVAVRPEQDPRVVNAFAWLSKQVGAPAGSTAGRPLVKDVGGLYYLWAMERVAVLYDVGRLDRKDWYLWGAEILLCHQKGEGHWDEGGYHGQHPVLNTAFALLFLKRANLTPDLSRRLTIDTTALTTKVDETVTPQPTPVKPQPQPEPSPPKTEEPPPKITPKQPSPDPSLPPKTTPTMEPPAPEPAPASPPRQSSSTWLWVVLALVLVAALGGGGFFLVKRSRQRAAEVEAAAASKRKKKKLKPKVVEDEE